MENLNYLSDTLRLTASGSLQLQTMKEQTSKLEKCTSGTLAKRLVYWLNFISLTSSIMFHSVFFIGLVTKLRGV